MQSILGSFPFKDEILSIPNDSCIFYRHNGTNYDIALAAWGYRSLKQPPCTDLTEWINQKYYQKVRIAFVWGNRFLPNCNFLLNGQKRNTSADGFFYITQELPVGNTYSISTMFGKVFSLKVEKGTEDYTYDLTQDFNVKIKIIKDGQPVTKQNCTVVFDNTENLLCTDELGCATIRLPLQHTQDGETALSQPLCKVICGDDQQEKTPTSDEKDLHFLFTTESAKHIDNPPLNPCEPDKPQTPQEPEMIAIKFLDYGGYPLTNVDFVLTTKKKGDVQLRTDSNGQCLVPCDWFTNREKMRIKYTISPEYQQTHNLHTKKQ